MSMWRSPEQKAAVIAAAKKRGMIPEQPAKTPETRALATDVATLTTESTKDSGRAILKERQPNKTEQRFLDICEARRKRNEIAGYRYEGIRLKWGGSMHYTPDVTIFENHNDRPVFVEVKCGHIFDRDIVRFKGCRAEWPEFAFSMWQWKSGEWRQIL